MRLTCLAATIHITLNYTTVLQERRSKLNGGPVKNSKPSTETLVSLPVTIWPKHKFIIGMNFNCPDLKTFCVIKRWTNNPRSKYHRSHCCFHTVITRTVLHPGTPRLHKQTESVPLGGKKKVQRSARRCVTHTAKRSVVLFSSVKVQEMFLQEPQHTWGSVDGSYTWCCT